MYGRRRPCNQHHSIVSASNQPTTQTLLPRYAVAQMGLFGGRRMAGEWLATQHLARPRTADNRQLVPAGPPTATHQRLGVVFTLDASRFTPLSPSPPHRRPRTYVHMIHTATTKATATIDHVRDRAPVVALNPQMPNAHRSHLDSVGTDEGGAAPLWLSTHAS
jgi:hypothetical protein